MCVRACVCACVCVRVCARACVGVNGLGFSVSWLGFSYKDLYKRAQGVRWDVRAHVDRHADSPAGAHAGKRVALHRRDASVGQVQRTGLGWA